MRILKKLLSRYSERASVRCDPLVDEYAQVLKSIITVEPWCVDFAQFKDGLIEIGGWAIPQQGDHSRTSFTINGYEFEEIKYPIPREDIERLFWYIPGSKESGFICRMSVSRNVAFPNGYAVFSYVDKKTKRPLRMEHNYYYYDILADKKLPIPDTDRRIRVHGGDSESAFLMEGFSTYMKLKYALRKTIGKDYNDLSNILDWGCGCGRMMRYFRDVKGPSIRGVDIDSDNVSWCNRNLPFSHFIQIPLHPPTALEDSSFDLLIGVSIFTHLREKEQFEWLGELRRLTSDEALLLMTVHSDTTVCRVGLSQDRYAFFRKKGFLDIGKNPDMDKVMKGEDYYRNIIHTREYIMENWSKYFKILDIIPGYIGNHQDLVVMRK